MWRHGIDTRAPDEDVYGDPLMTVNLSVWQSVEHLKNFVYRGFHRDVFRRRKEWFTESGVVLWWIPAGSIPSLAEGRDRLQHLRANGPSSIGFRLREDDPHRYC